MTVVQTCYLGGSVPPLRYPEGYVGTFGAPWGAMGAAGWTRQGPESDSVSLSGRFWHPILKGFLGTEVSDVFLFEFVSRMCFVPISQSKSKLLGCQYQVFMRKILQNAMFHTNQFLRVPEHICAVFRGFGDSFSRFAAVLGPMRPGTAIWQRRRTQIGPHWDFPR